MDDPLYREIILDHWKHPHNAGIIEDADIDVHDVNPLCGDDIRLTIKLSPAHPETDSESQQIEAIKFAGQGCAISQASASLLTDEVLHMTTEAVKAITPEKHLEELGIALTPARLKCALLSYMTLQKGIK